jgi:hypothetical protein
MPLVRTTFFDDLVEVPDDEIPVLRAQGLLVGESAPQPAADPVPVKPTASKTKDA